MSAALFRAVGVHSARSITQLLSAHHARATRRWRTAPTTPTTPGPAPASAWSRQPHRRV